MHDGKINKDKFHQLGISGLESEEKNKLKVVDLRPDVHMTLVDSGSGRHKMFDGEKMEVEERHKKKHHKMHDGKIKQR